MVCMRHSSSTLFSFSQILKVKETQHSVRDSESGLHRMAIGHHLGKYRALLKIMFVINISLFREG